MGTAARVCACVAALPPTAAALFAIERRLNFDASGLTTRARAEERFLSRLGEMGCFEWRRVAPTFAQRFEYERVKELVLWRVSLSLDAHVEPLAAIDRARVPSPPPVINRAGPPAMTAAEAVAAAAAEGLTLVRSETNTSGFLNVHVHASDSTPWQAKIRQDAWNLQYLGCFATAEEAALAVARYRANPTNIGSVFSE